MNWKIYAAFVSGGVLGGIATWYGVKKYYEKIANEEIEDMKKYFTKKKEELETEYKSDEFGPNVAYPVDEDDIDNSLEIYEKKITPYNTMYKTQEKPSLESIRAEKEYPTDDDEEFDSEEIEDEIEIVRETNTPNELPGPIIISEEDYASDWRFEKVAITYYIDDDTLADTDETIMDIRSTVSREAIDELVMNELDAIYVRNEKIGIDYEITYRETKYSEEVLGLISDDEEIGGRRPMKKRKEKLDDEE